MTSAPHQYHDRAKHQPTHNNYFVIPFHDFPFEGIWLLKKSGYPDFEKRLLDLLSMDQDHYKKQCKHYPGYVIGYDESKPTHIAISEFIQQHIQQYTGVAWDT